MTSKKKRRVVQQPKPKRYKTLAEGFAAAAEQEQRKLDLYSEIAKTMRGEKRE